MNPDKERKNLDTQYGRERRFLIYYLNPPSEALADRLKCNTQLAKSIEEMCSVMAFDPDEEKRVHAERILRGVLIKTYFDLQIVEDRAFIAISHYFPPSPFEYVYVCSAPNQVDD